MKYLPILLLSAALFAQQERRTRVDVEHYDINVTVLPATQNMTAKVKMRVMPVDDRITSMQLDFNDALRMASVTDDAGAPVTFTKTADFSYRLQFAQPLLKGKAVTISFEYEGRFDGREESPVNGIRFAAIEASGASFLYPARWFPVNEYTSDRFTMNLNVTVPAEFRVLSSGIDLKSDAAGQSTYSFKTTQPALYGSFAVVRGNPTRVSAEGVSSSMWFSNAAIANEWSHGIEGDEFSVRVEREATGREPEPR